MQEQFDEFNDLKSVNSHDIQLIDVYSQVLQISEHKSHNYSAVPFKK